MLVANGALLGMNIKLVGAFLKTMELQTWNQLALFVTILALRNRTSRKYSRIRNSYLPLDPHRTDESSAPVVTETIRLAEANINDCKGCSRRMKRGMSPLPSDKSRR